MKLKKDKTLSWFMTENSCNYSGLDIISPESFKSNDRKRGFYSDVAKLGNDALLVKSYGYVTSAAESEFQEFIDGFISRHFNTEEFIYIEDYEGLTGGDAESRKKHIAYFKSKKHMIAAIVFSLPSIYKISFNLLKKLHFFAARAHAVKTYEQAVDLSCELIQQHYNLKDPTCQHAGLSSSISKMQTKRSAGSSFLESISDHYGRFRQFFNRMKWNRFFLTEKAKSELTQDFSEKIIQYVAAIDWQKPGMPPATNVLDDVSSKKMIDAISFVKSEIDTLIEERAAAEAVLRESEARYRLLVKHAKAGFLEYDYITNQIISVNDELVHLTGYLEQDLLGMAPVKLLTEDSQKKFIERLSKIKSGETISQNIVYQGVTKNNGIRWWLLNSNVAYDNNRPAKASVVLTDITQLKHTEKQLLEYQEKLKRLSIRMSMIEEDQRRSMASHLHETIGQELFVMLLQLNEFEKSIDNPALLFALTPIKEQLLKIIKETKNLTFDLSPPVLYDFGFEEALKTLAETIELKHNIHVDACFEGEMDCFDDEIKVIVYRNLKELIHNCVKHADANNITMRLIHSQSGLNVELRDDGVGFDPVDFINETASHDGFGLFDIREKLNHLGGHLIIDSAPGQGTSISMQVPLSLSN